jgi:DNA polymerase-3 subunit alpha
MTDCLPIFKSHYSLGKSILTLNKYGSSEKNAADSVIDIAVDNNLSNIFLVEDNMSSFFEASQNLTSKNIILSYGLKLAVCNDLTDKSDDSIKTESKIVIFAKNPNGIKALIKIWDIAAINGFYYIPRTDYKSLKKLWREKDLMLCIPFYDSYVHNNLLSTNLCVPDFSFTDPVYFVEDNGLPFDDFIKSKVNSLKDIKTINTQSIYYKMKKDFVAYQTFRCISKRTNLNKPNLEHMCSDTFSFESWANKAGKEIK